MTTQAHASVLPASRRSRRRLPSRALGVAAALAALPLTGPAQTTPAPAPETVALPQFTVRDTRTSAYGATEAISTTRVSMPIDEVPQTVSVVTRELMDDTQAFRMIDVVKFVTPVQESSLVEGSDRITLRGFQVSQRFVDGVNVSGLDGYNMTSDTSNVERLEIIKGPNAILVPGGSPGGIINQITKSPKFENFGALSLQYKEYLNNEASIDVNRVFDSAKHTAGRLVFSVWDQQHQYFRDAFRKGWLVAPSVSHLFGNGAQLTVKLESLYNDQTQGIGAVIDPSVGTNGTARVVAGMPRNWAWGGPDTHRQRWETRLTSELDFKLGDTVSARLWLMADHATRNDKGPSGGAPAAGLQGSRNPLTGEWVPFMSFASTAPFAGTALTPSASQVYIRSGQSNLLKFDELHLKNDYAAELTLAPGITSTTIGGLSANYQRLIWKNLTATAPSVDFANLAATEDYNPTATVYTLNKDKAGEQTDLQIFGYQRFGFFDNRLIVAGGVSEFWGQLARTDESNLPVTKAPNVRTLSNAVTDANLGAIVKVVPGVSLFAGYNRVGGALPTSILAGEVPKNFLIQVGDQVEAGVKSSLLHGRLNLSASYFNIKQNNFQVPNSAFALDPTQPQFLFYDLKSRGVEVEVNTLITRELALVGNFTRLHMRDAYGIRQRDVPDNAGALFAKYTFADGDLKGLGFSIGLDYKGDMAGDQTSGVTAASTPGHVIANQPSFYVAGRTLLSAGVSYKRDNWELAMLVDNVTNKDYIEATLARTVIYPGLPRTWSARFTYKF